MVKKRFGYLVLFFSLLLGSFSNLSALEVVLPDGKAFINDGEFFFDVGDKIYKSLEEIEKVGPSLPLEVKVIRKRGKVTFPLGSIFVFDWKKRIIIPYYVLDNFPLSFSLAENWKDSPELTTHYYVKVKDILGNVLWESYFYSLSGGSILYLRNVVVNGEYLQIEVYAQKEEIKKKIYNQTIKVSAEKKINCNLDSQFLTSVEVSIYDKYRKIYKSFPELAVILTDGKTICKLTPASDGVTFKAFYPPFWKGEEVELKVFEKGMLHLRKKVRLFPKLGTLFLEKSHPLKRFQKLIISNFEGLSSHLLTDKFLLQVKRGDYTQEFPFPYLEKEIVLPYTSPDDYRLPVEIQVKRDGKLIYQKEGIRREFLLPVFPIIKPTIVVFADSVPSYDVVLVSENLKEKRFMKVDAKQLTLTLPGGEFFAREVVKLYFYKQGKLSEPPYFLKLGKINTISFEKKEASNKKPLLSELKNFSLQIEKDNLSFSYGNDSEKALPFKIELRWLSKDCLFLVSEFKSDTLIFEKLLAPKQTVTKKVKFEYSGNFKAKEKIILHVNIDIKGKKYSYTREVSF